MLKKYLIIFLGSISLILTIVKSGLTYDYGQGFWGANGHDGIWHIALSESLSKGTLDNPIFAGTKIQNYHLGFDILLVLINQLTNIPINYLYFQILPIIFAILIGYLTYKFVFLWLGSNLKALLATFFVYFGGSFAYLIGKGESVFWSQQSVSTLINPPYALSLILMLLGFIFLLKKKYFFSVLIFSILIFVKVYAGLLILFALFVVSIYQLIANRYLLITKMFLGTLTLSSLIYFSFNRLGSDMIVFQPFWFLETMMGLTDHVGWVKFGEAMLNYKSGYVLLKGSIAYFVAFLIFIIGNFGTRLIALCYMPYARKVKNPELNIMIFSTIGAGIVIPTLFVQKGTPWNTIQFLYYSLFFSGVLAGITLSQITIKHKAFGIILVLLTIPTTLITLRDVYIPNRPPAMISNEEIEALNFLRKQPQGVVLTYPFDEFKAKEAEKNPPRPLFLYTSTAYVSAYSAKPVFLEDEINLDITGYNWKERRLEIEKWYKENDQEKARKFLKDNNIKYVYWIKPLPAQAGQRALLGETQLGLEKIFENKEVIIYKYVGER